MPAAATCHLKIIRRGGYADALRSYKIFVNDQQAGSIARNATLELDVPSGPLKVEDEEMARLARDEGLEVMKPELNTKPRVYYRNLWRYSKCFIGGSVADEKNGVVDCVEGASVQLVKDGVSVAVTTTDNYGDFKFDRLDENSGRYTVQIFSGGRTKTVEASLGASINLGEIRL